MDSGGRPTDVTEVTSRPAGDAVPRPRARVLGVVLSVFALCIAAVFVVGVVRVDSDGAPTPEDAVRALFAALEQNDAIGVLEALAPSERTLLRAPIQDTVAGLQDVGILAPFDLAGVPGIDVAVHDLTLSSSLLSDDLSSVRIERGTVSSDVRLDDLVESMPLREAIQQRWGSNALLSSTTDLVAPGAEVLTLRERDGWHVSLFYSIVDSTRDLESPRPEYGNGLQPVGATTPEGAVRSFLDAWYRWDLLDMIEQLDPHEMRVLYDYGPLWAAEDTQSSDDDIGGEVRALELRSSGTGDVRQLLLERIDARMWSRGATGTTKIGGGCVNHEIAYENPILSWSGEDEADVLSGCEGGLLLVNGVMPSVDRRGVPNNPFLITQPMAFGSNVFSGVVGFTVVRRGDLWFVSPTRSVLSSLLAALDRTEREIVETALAAFVQAGVPLSERDGHRSGNWFTRLPDVDCDALFDDMITSDSMDDARYNAFRGICVTTAHTTSGEVEWVDPDDPAQRCQALFHPSTVEQDLAGQADVPDFWSEAALETMATAADCFAEQGTGDERFLACVRATESLLDASDEEKLEHVLALTFCFDEAFRPQGDDDEFDLDEFQAELDL